jgi:hypothetical protein
MHHASKYLVTALVAVVAIAVVMRVPAVRKVVVGA